VEPARAAVVRLRRWGAFLAALAATAVLAVGFAVWVDHVSAGAEPSPVLHTVAAGELTRAGVTLAAPGQPPYCGVDLEVAGQRLASAGPAGCAVSEQAARSSLLPAFQGAVTEAVLARVSGPSAIGQDRLVWLLVVRSSLLVLPTSRCAAPRANGPACMSLALGQISTEAVVFVDGTTGQVLTTLPVAGPAPTPSAAPAR
jgi:hypothetical protein